MRRTAIAGIFMIIPALLLLSTTPGCGKKDATAKKETASKKSPAAEEKKAEEAAGGKKAVGDKWDGTIKGQVTYDGDPPSEPLIKAIEAHKNKDECLKGKEFETHEQLWIVDKKSKGVANVVVWLKPPANSYFRVRDEDKKPKNADLDQPHCAFIPHVIALFPVYFDGTKEVPTGQKLVVHNSAEMSHNTAVTGSEIKNPRRSVTIPSKGKTEFDIKYQSKPLQIGCDIHSWMNAKAFTFDNPYFAVTDLQGNFKIENAPSGVEVTAVGWHEAKGEFKKDALTIKAGNNAIEWKITK